MAVRQIKGLRWARRLAGRPSCIPQGRPRLACKKAGLRYEAALAAALPQAAHGVWWEFEDAEGHGYCQTDLLWQRQGLPPVVLEAKLSWVAVGHLQLEQLYGPVVEMALGQQPKLVLVTRRLTSGAVGCHVSYDLQSALVAPGRSVLLWLGKSALGPARQPALAA